MKKLNLGCGQIRPEGWINTDSSINSFIQKFPLGNVIANSLGLKLYDSSKMSYMNLNKKWKGLKTSSVQIVYASHLFEHLSIKSRTIFLKEAYRVLASGGIIRLVVPDLEAHAKEYIDNYKRLKNSDPAKQFMWVLNLHREGQYPNERKMHNFIGKLQDYPHQHKFMYDKYSLGEILKEFGFGDINISEFGKSNYISEINDVEFNVDKSYGNSLYIEAIKK